MTRWYSIRPHEYVKTRRKGAPCRTCDKPEAHMAHHGRQVRVTPKRLDGRALVQIDMTFDSGGRWFHKADAFGPGAIDAFVPQAELDCKERDNFDRQWTLMLGRWKRDNGPLPRKYEMERIWRYLDPEYHQPERLAEELLTIRRNDAAA